MNEAVQCRLLLHTGVRLPSKNVCAPQEAIPMACRLVAGCEDFEALTHACWALTYLTSGEEGRAALMQASHREQALSKLANWVRWGG
jgi:hypothetical protein